MSITLTITDLINLFTAVKNPDYPASGTNFPLVTRIRERVALEDFPTIMVGQDWKSPHQFDYKGDDRTNHQYTVAIYVFVGGKGTDLEELQKRAEQWPVPIKNALTPHITLSGDVTFIGNGEASPYIPYDGPLYWPWGGGESYFGYRFTLLINEEGKENFQA